MRGRRLLIGSSQAAKRPRKSTQRWRWRSRRHRRHPCARTCWCCQRRRSPFRQEGATYLYVFTMLREKRKPGYHEGKRTGGFRDGVRSDLHHQGTLGVDQMRRCGLRVRPTFSTRARTFGEDPTSAATLAQPQPTRCTAHLRPPRQLTVPPPYALRPPPDRPPAQRPRTPAAMLLLDYQNVLIESLLRERFQGCAMRRRGSLRIAR